MSSYMEAAQKRLVHDNGSEIVSSGLFSAVLSKPGRDGAQYENIVLNDVPGLPWRFKTLHPMAVAAILDHPEDAAAALDAAMSLKDEKRTRKPRAVQQRNGRFAKSA